MQSQIEEKIAQDRIKTAHHYRSALRSFTVFLHTLARRPSVRTDELTETLVLSYENYLLHERGITRNSSSFYIRQLHTIYKRSVRLLRLKRDDPFENAYTGIEKTRKRAVHVNIIVQLMQCEGLNTPMAFSRDTFVFCFFAHGMPFIDFAKLRKENLTDGRLTYRRSKTGSLISVKVNDIMLQLIRRYACPDTPYLFPVLKDVEFSQTGYDSALRSYNQNLKRLSEMLGLKTPLTSYVPRHTWASEALRLHVPTHVISRSMGHTDEKTTSIYLTSLDYRDVDCAAKKIFDNVMRKRPKENKIKGTPYDYVNTSYTNNFPRFYYSTSTLEMDKNNANVDKKLILTK